jgi:hypothetical protein
MAGQQSLFDFPGARLELVQPLSLVRSFSSEEALDLEFTEKTLHNPKREAEEQEEELIVPKKGLFLAFLGLFLQTKGG